LNDDEKRLYARMMEVYAGFLTHTDSEVGRLLDFIEELGELDDTVVLLMSDKRGLSRGRAPGFVQRDVLFQLRARERGREPGPDRPAGWTRGLQPLSLGLGLGRNTPLKRWKRETHEGGGLRSVDRPLARQTRTSGRDAPAVCARVDVMPTLLELIGIEPPEQINGVRQRPIEGISFAPLCSIPAIPGVTPPSTTRCSDRGRMYHEGWKAVVFRPLPFVHYTEGDDPFRSYEDDDWELYHVAEDFSETRDLAAEHPEKLAELVDIWWREAERYNVLPLTNMPIVGMDHRYNREALRLLLRESAPSRSSLLPNISNRAWSLRAELVVPEGGAEGAIVGHGNHAGGYVVFLRHGRLHFTYNHLEQRSPRWRPRWSCRPDPSRPGSSSHRPGPMPATSTSSTGDVPVGQGHVPRTTLVTVGVHGFTVATSGARPSTRSSPDATTSLPAPFAEW